MDIAGFKKFLTERKISEDIIDYSVKTVEEFKEFIKKNGRDIDNATRDDFYEYSDHLVRSKQNTYEKYVSLLRYGNFAKNRDLTITGLEVLDGSEVFTNFYNRLKEEYGETLRDKVFDGFEMPPLGLRPGQKPAFTKAIISRLEKALDTAKCREFLNKGLRDRYEEWRKPDHDQFLKCKNIDEFLAWKRKKFNEELEQHYKNGTLFFTQEITTEVLEYVKNHPHIETGVREDDRLLITKIPYNAKEYLKETDLNRKRYFYCHCPWVREALPEGGTPIPSIFCNCSAGYYRAYWEIVLGKPVKVEVLDSVLKGGLECRFVVYL